MMTDYGNGTRRHDNGPYDQPNYGANAAMGTTLGQSGMAATRPTVCSVADLTNELQSRLSLLEELLRTVHQRIGASHGPEAATGSDALMEANGPVDFAATQIMVALGRIDNFRTIVETINARI